MNRPSLIATKNSSPDGCWGDGYTISYCLQRPGKTWQQGVEIFPAVCAVTWRQGVELFPAVCAVTDACGVPIPAELLEQFIKDCNLGG